MLLLNFDKTRGKTTYELHIEELAKKEKRFQEFTRAELSKYIRFNPLKDLYRYNLFEEEIRRVYPHL